MNNKLDTINLLFCCDDKCFDGLLLTLLSAQRNTEHPINAFVLTGNFKTKKKEYFSIKEDKISFIEKTIQKYNDKSSIKLMDMTDEALKHFSKSRNLHGKFSPFALLRLLADFHPEFGDRLLYLDIDLVITGDLYKIYSFDLEGKDIGMVLDEVGSHWLGKDYCNSGVLLMNLKQLRENHHFDIVRKKVIKNFYFMPDQTALNRGMKKYKKIMSPRFNDQHFLHDDTVIRHYCQWIRISRFWLRNVAEKPWNFEKFEKIYGPEMHKEILDEFKALRDDFKKEGASH